MNTDVVIKANGHGIRIILSNDCSFDEIIRDIKLKLIKNKSFLKKSGNVNVVFEGRALSKAEIKRILYELNNLPETGVKFISESNEYRLDILPHKKNNEHNNGNGMINKQNIKYDQYFDRPENIKKNKRNLKDASYPGNLFFYGNLCNGQVLETKKSIIIIGNVERKARIISNGNIIIIGSLKGEAIAGRDLHPKRFVLALNMEPVHIKIGRADFLPQRQCRKKFNTNDAVIAYCDNGQLIFNMLSQTSL